MRQSWLTSYYRLASMGIPRRGTLPTDRCPSSCPVRSRVSGPHWGHISSSSEQLQPARALQQHRSSPWCSLRRTTTSSSSTQRPFEASRWLAAPCRTWPLRPRPRLPCRCLADRSDCRRPCCPGLMTTTRDFVSWVFRNGRKGPFFFFFLQS